MDVFDDADTIVIQVTARERDMLAAGLQTQLNKIAEAIGGDTSAEDRAQLAHTHVLFTRLLAKVLGARQQHGTPLGRCGSTKSGQHIESDDDACEACGEEYERG